MFPNSTIHTIGQPFIELITVDSTNNYAMGQLQTGTITHGTAWFAYNQTAGKGQRSKQWHSQPGQNIILSVALNTNILPVSAQFYLSAAIALAAHALFGKYAGSETCVKWPNDIYWNDKKAGGILIENIIRGDKWQWAVAGIGMNINQMEFDGNASNAVSLKQITGKNYDILALAKELCGFINIYFERLLGDRVELLSRYNTVLYKRGKEARFRKNNILFAATVDEVSADGRLRVKGAAWDSFSFGEIEWVLP